MEKVSVACIEDQTSYSIPLSQHGLLNILSPLLKPTAQEKKISFKILLRTDNVPGYQRALMEGCNEITLVFTPAGTTSILQPMD